MHPSHTFCQQQSLNVIRLYSRGRGSMQIGQSSAGGRSLNKASSYISLARFLQASLCCERSANWQTRLQYLTILQAEHILNISPSDSHLLQLAQVIMRFLVSIVDDMFIKFFYLEFMRAETAKRERKTRVFQQYSGQLLR